MDWGGLIAGAMGGGAKAMVDVANDTMKRRDLELAAQRTEQVAIKGEERRAALQRENAAYEMDLKLKREDDQGKRYQAQTDQITDRAKQIGNNRDIETAKSLAPSMDQPALNSVRANLSPEDQEKFYGIKQQRSSGLIGDQIAAAREIGADKPVRDDLRGSYDKQVAAEALTRKEDRSDRDATRREAKDDESARANLAREAEAGRRTDALFAKISSGNGNGNAAKGDTKEWLSLIGQQRLGYKDELAQIRSDKKLAIDAEPNPKKKVEVIARFDAKIESLQPKLQAIDDKIEAVTSRLLDKDGAPTLPTRPAPAAKEAAPKSTMPALPQGAKAIGTSGGRTVYQTPDGKKYIGN